MNARLASFAKVASLQHDNGRNFTVSASHLRNAVLFLAKFGRRIEARYELGVYSGAHSVNVDYVIRHHHLDQDLTALLRAFDCEPLIPKTNIHAINSSTIDLAKSDHLQFLSKLSNPPTESEIQQMNEQQLYTYLNHFPLRNGDRLHNDFLKTADRINAQGIEKAISLKSIYGKFVPNPGP